MKIKKEILILIGIIVVLGIYITQRKTDRTHYTLPTLPPVENAEIDKMEVIRDGQTLTLTRKDDQWYIAPGDKLADKNKVSGMAGALADLQVTALVSEAASYNRYELDEKAKIVLKGWQGDKLVREVDLGKAASTFQHTFVKLPDNPNVYHAKGHLRPKFEYDADALRDLTVLKVAADGIRTLTVARGEVRATFQRQTPPETTDATEAESGGENAAEKAPASPEPQWINTASGEPVNPDLISDLLQDINPLECTRYLKDRTPADFADRTPDYELVLQNSGSQTLALFAPENEEAGDYSGISSQNDEAFVIAKWEVEDLEKKIDSLMQSPMEKESEPGVEPAGEAEKAEESGT